MEVSIPGKILLLGGYAVLKGHLALSLAVTDFNGKGMVAFAEEGAEHIVSDYFSLDVTPSFDGELIAIAYAYAKKYLKTYHSFIPCSVELKYNPIFGTKENKTGLGSSAAATVAVVSSVLGFNGISDRRLINKISQYAHAKAFGKIGSGFDVASCTEGTILYKRFSPHHLEDFSNIVKKWDWRIEQFNFPYEVYLFNVKGKMDTREAIKKANLDDAILALQADYEQKVLSAISSKNDGKIRTYMRKARAVSKRISPYVEPDELTSIINAVEDSVEGVVAGRCPGAGGFDSVVFIGRDVDVRAISSYGLDYVPVRLFSSI